MIRRIVLTGGGTAGSVTPLLALADQLRRVDSQVELLFIGTTDGPERLLVESAGIRFRALAAGKLRRYWSWRNLLDLGNIWQGYVQSRKIMREWRPQVVVSAGSYVSVPVIWAAHHLGIHTLIHQQDVRPGLANKLMAPAADRITVAFESSLKDFPRRKVTWTGNPVRPSIFQGSAATAREIFHLPTTQPVLLVIGGGTGSAHLNQVVGSAAYKLVRQWSVIHITGQQRDFPELHHEHYVATPFLTWQIPHALALADLVICRAGLGTFSELAALAKSAIFVPMPDSHQEDNARVIREAQAGVVIPQSRFDQQRLLAETDRLLAAANERATLGQRLHRFYRPKALVDLTDEVLRLTAQ